MLEGQSAAVADFLSRLFVITGQLRSQVVVLKDAIFSRQMQVC